MEKLCRIKNSKNWQCGKLVFNGTNLCKRHYDLDQERNVRRSMKKKKREECGGGMSEKSCRIKNSKKWRCGKPVFHGTSFCKKHYDLNQERNMRRNMMRRNRQESGGSLSEKLDGIRASHLGRGRPKLSETKAENVDSNVKKGIEKNHSSDESSIELGGTKLKKQRVEESDIREGKAVGDAKLSALDCETKIYDSNYMGQQISPKCHMCLRNDKVGLIYCSNCKKKCYCYDCLMKWFSGQTFEEFENECPFCRGICNCIACLSGDYDTVGTSSALWRVIRCHYGGVFHMQEGGQVYSYKGGCYMDTPRWVGNDINYTTLLRWILDNLPVTKVSFVDMYWFHCEKRKVIETEEDLSYMWRNASEDGEGKTHIYVQYIQPIAVDGSDYQPPTQTREVTPETQASKRARDSTEEEPNSDGTKESGGIARGWLDEEMKACRENHPHGFVAKPATDGSLNLMV